MGILSGIKAMLGTPKVVGAVADTVKAGMSIWDKSKFTEQEQSEMSLEGMKLWLKIQEATANENSIKSITRRWIACGIVGTYLSSFFITLICRIFSEDAARFVRETVETFELGYLTIGVCSFYFVYYGIQGMRKKS